MTFLLVGLIGGAGLLKSDAMPDQRPLPSFAPVDVGLIQADAAMVGRYREGLDTILKARREAPKGAGDVGLSQEQRDELRSHWRMWLDFTMALKAVADRSQGASHGSTKAHNAAYLNYYAAFLTQYRYSFDWIEVMENVPGADEILNEPIADLGVSAGTYTDYKMHFLNMGKGVEFASSDAVYAALADAAGSVLERAIEMDRALIWRKARGEGPAKTIVNGASVVTALGARAWMPLQKGVASWMGDTKVRRRGVNLITQGQIARLKTMLHPGDILLSRHEWYLSNIGLPGYWPHMELYVGTPEERAVFFNEPEVLHWLKDQRAESLESLLCDKAGGSDLARFSTVPDGHETRVVEAISEGVSLTSLEHGAGSDSFAALRPRVSKLAKARALVRAFSYLGRPYDFNFDFDTDRTMVCSEVVVKAYEESLPIVIGSVMGRRVTPPNLLARQYCEQGESAGRLLDLVVFYDGREWKDCAEEADEAAFCASWRRPKWHVWVQEIGRQ